MPPTDPEMHALQSLMQRGDFAAAAALTRALIRQHPREALLHNVLGVAQMQEGRPADAARAFRRALELAPGHDEANHNLIAALLETGALAEAEAPIRLALTRSPRDAGLLRNLASVLMLRQDWEAALDSVEAALAIEPDHPAALMTRATILHALERREAALAILARFPDDPQALRRTAEIHAALGDADAARAAYDAALARDPDLGSAWDGLASITRFTPDTPLLARMQAARTTASPETRMHLDYALAKAMADLGHDTAVFAHLHAANAARATALPPYSHAQRRKEIARIKALFTPQAVARLAPAGDPAALPVFIVGMPRSGTTLIEQILASHPAVHGAGERPEIGRIGRHLLANPRGLTEGFIRETAAAHLARLRGLAPQARRVTDKMPENADWVGLILTLFPKARIIRTLRDPRDIALSVYRANFANEGLNWACDLEAIASYHTLHCDLMEHWQTQFPDAIKTCRYEELVADPETGTRALAAHCGLDWDPAMLAPHQTRRAVVTASAAQVRDPISDRSVGGWRRFEADLAPFVAALARLGRPVA